MPANQINLLVAAKNSLSCLGHCSLTALSASC